MQVKAKHAKSIIGGIFFLICPMGSTVGMLSSLAYADSVALPLQLRFEAPELGQASLGGFDKLSPTLTMAYPVDSRSFLQLGSEGIGGSYFVTSNGGASYSIDYWYDRLLTGNPAVLKFKVGRRIQSFTTINLDVGSSLSCPLNRRTFGLNIGHSF